jgi:hypothetical protein
LRDCHAPLGSNVAAFFRSRLGLPALGDRHSKRLFGRASLGEKVNDLHQKHIETSEIFNGRPLTKILAKRN